MSKSHKQRTDTPTATDPKPADEQVQQPEQPEDAATRAMSEKDGPRDRPRDNDGPRVEPQDRK